MLMVCVREGRLVDGMRRRDGFVMVCVGETACEMVCVRETAYEMVCVGETAYEIVCVGETAYEMVCVGDGDGVGRPRL